MSRGQGKSAVAAAAYRSGEKLTNEWDGMTHDYTRKGGVVHTEIMLPPHAPPSFSDRSTLWNSVELYEKAGNAQLAREIDAALPIELSREEQIRLVREYCSSQFVSRGMCVDFAIHDTDSGNPHCHIMLTMRPLDERGAWAAKSKKEYDLDENGERIRLPSGRYKTHKVDLTGWNDKDNTLLWRKAWADYCWNIFSTIIFVQECLKRFGEPGDQFVLIYREKDEKEVKEKEKEAAVQVELDQQSKEYQNSFSSMLIKSKNLIFRGAPGTGKSYLAKEIAADIVSNGYEKEYSHLTEEQKKQVEFVQFHPSYDYSDFVEGLRPKVNSDGTMGFELQDGIFKRFVDRARKNYEDSQKSKETVEQEVTVQESMTEFFSGIEFGVDTFKTINGNEFTITGVDDGHINISIPGNASVNRITLNLDEVRKMLESGQKFEKIKDITSFFGKTFATQGYSYDFAIYKAIKAKKSTVSKAKAKQEELKKYIFIIDEINRGEISKIFGELFFAIDPGYRGKAGEISTQYSNLHSDPDEKFYIPENVYIIGTMNDIDRSVDSFDFAMRRRFRFVELRADEHLEAINESIEDEGRRLEAIRRMAALNKEIVSVEDLNENYQIGAAYFAKLKTLDFDQLWTDYLQPLLQEYIQGMYDEEGIMNRFARAYGYQKPARGDANEAAQDQG